MCAQPGNPTGPADPACISVVTLQIIGCRIRPKFLVPARSTKYQIVFETAKKPPSKAERSSQRCERRRSRLGEEPKKNSYRLRCHLGFLTATYSELTGLAILLSGRTRRD